MPDLTIASAMLLIMSSLTLQANLFQEFQPIGGVRARSFDTLLFSCAPRQAHSSRTLADAIRTRPLVLMEAFYHKPSIFRLDPLEPRISVGARSSLRIHARVYFPRSITFCAICCRSSMVLNGSYLASR